MKTKIALVLVALFCCGSSCCPDLPGGVARRHFTGQKIGSINTQGANDGVDSRPDKGGNGSSQCGLWTQYRDSSDAPVEIGGVRVDICTTYYFPSGGIIQESRKKVYTYPNGYAFWYVGGSTPSSGSYQVDFISRTNGARSNASIGGMFRRVCPSWTDDVGYKECYPPFGSAPYPVQGEYYGSGSQNGEGNLAFDINGNRTGLPSFLPSSAEQSFLDAEPNHFDNVPVQATGQWCIAKRSGTGFTSKPVSELVMLFEGEDPNNDVIREQSTPYFVEWHFYTADEVSLAGQEFQAVIKVSSGGCDPNISDPNNYADIKIKVISDGEDGYAHIAHSGFIVVVEPNNFSPYVLATEGGDILVAPLNEGAILSFDFRNQSQFVGLAAKYWLGDFRPFDFNGDGIVNFKDFLEVEK